MTDSMANTGGNASRIQILDIIRGIAVLGILGVNIFCYAMPEILADALPITDPDRGLGYCLGIASEILLSGKMRSLFAMLFGISSVIILDRLAKRYDGQQGTLIFFRRMLWLLIFGQIHGFLFLFYGDILFHYAIMGMIAFPLYYASSKTRVVAMLICLAVLTYKPYRDYVYTVELEAEYLEIIDQATPEDELSEYDQAVIEEWDEYTAYIDPAPEDYEEEIEAKLGGYLAAFEYNTEGVVLMATYDLYNWYAWEILLYMLLGISLFRAGFFSEDFPSKTLLLMALLGLAIGGSAHVWLHLAFYNTYFDHVRSIYYLIYFDLGRLPMVLGYVALISLAFRLKLLAIPGKWLAATGKMTLTNYLMQSIIAAVVFVGFRQFNQLDRVQLGLVLLAIWTFQIAFSNLWMKYFTYGPFEWVWRSLTYWRAQPWKRTPPLCLLLAFCLIGSFTGRTDAEYTYSCWPNGWRKNANDQSADIFAIETSHFGFTLDVADFRRVGFGRLDNPAGYQQALEHKADKLKQLPPAELLIELEVDGVRYRARACRAGREKGVKRLSHVRLWESGRYVQHYDFLGLDFRNAEGKQLPCDATLDVVAWPGSLTLNVDVSPASPLNRVVLRLALNSQAGSWRQQQKVDSWQQGQSKRISLDCPVASPRRVPPESITVTAATDQRFPVRFDATRNCYVASVNRLKRDWRTGYTDIRRYDEFKITVEGSGAKAAVPFLLDLRPPANVTGLCPILCDEDGRPTGIPVQLSKNWHFNPMGAYLMAYTMLPADKDATYLLRVAYGFYGTLPSASHAQLSLVGYGGNGRWDQLAIGCWGETICFDMDMSLVDVAITDIRALMIRDGVNGRKWGWTNAGWGGDWLNLHDASQNKFLWTDLKTAYLAHGPCLTQVEHRGCYGAHREVDFSARIQTLRTNDYCRTFQQLSYTFTRDVSAQKMWLYKLGRTFHYRTPRIAYGNSDGLIKEHDVPEPLGKGQLFLNEVELTGRGPFWLAFAGAAEAANNRPKPNGYRALIVRKYEATIGGRAFANPTFSTPVHKADPTSLDIELLPPAGIRNFSKGDRVELDLELITLPRVADDYYGPNESFRRHLVANPNSWKTTYREAQGNDLELTVSGGQVLQRYPIVIHVEEPEVAVTIRGGVGAVPIRFEGLESGEGYRLYQVSGGKRTPFDQSVRGNDYWQTDYDAATDSYAMTFNLPLDGLGESEWVFARPTGWGSR